MLSNICSLDIENPDRSTREKGVFQSKQWPLKIVTPRRNPLTKTGFAGNVPRNAMVCFEVPRYVTMERKRS
jgi:hypothetical protein